MDPDFKDLLPWQEMSKAIKDLQETQAVIKAYFAEGPSRQIHDLREQFKLMIAEQEKHWEAIQQDGRHIASLWKVINELSSHHN